MSTGRIVGYKHGEGDFRGFLGALIIDSKGKRLKITGFLRFERDYGSIADGVEAYKHPGEIAADWVLHWRFPKGKIIEFEYSADGILKR